MKSANSRFMANGFLSKCDLFGPLFTFEYNNSNRFLSSQGGCITIVLVFLLGIISALVSKEVFLRQLPNINYYSIYSDVMNFYINEIPLAFSIINTTDGSSLDEKKANAFFTFSFESKSRINSSLVMCEKDLYGGNYTNIINDVITQNQNFYVLCLSQSVINSKDFLINKDYNQNTESSLKLKFVLNDPNFDLSEIQIVTYYYGITMNLMNQNNPIEHTMRNFKLSLQPNAQQIQYLYYQQVQIILDNNYLFSFTENEVLSIKNMQIRIPNVAPFLENSPYMLVLSPTTKIDVFSRVYLKLSDSLALIGGLSNALFVFFKFMFEPYLRYLYFLFLKKFTFEFYIKEMQKVNFISSFKANKIEEKFKNSLSMIPINDSAKMRTQLRETKKEELKPAQSSFAQKMKRVESAPLVVRPCAFSNLIKNLQACDIHADLSLGYFSYLC